MFDEIETSPVTADAETRILQRETRILAELRAWTAERIHNSPVSRDTAAYNHLAQELPGLAGRLARLQED